MKNTSNLAMKMDAEEIVLKVVPKNEDMADPLDKLLNRKPLRQHLREFGSIFAIIAFLAAAYCFLSLEARTSGLALTFGGLVLAVLGYRAPAALHTPWKAWMAFGNYLGIAVTFVLLSAMWLGMFIPMSLVLRIVGKHVMDMSFREDRVSYWQDRQTGADDFKLLERQF